MAKRLNRAESREQTRQRILEAAADLFARNGYRSTSVDDVAEAAGYSKGAFYYNFDSKDDLFDALVDEHIEGLTTELEKALTDATTMEEKIAAVQRALVRKQRERIDPRLEFEVIASAVRDPKVRKRVAAAYRRMREAIAGLIEKEYAEVGAKPPMTPEHLALTIMAGSQGLALMQAIDPDAVPAGIMPSILGLVLRSPAPD
ncbi:MAG: TetR/AcrR family transcriptional regulator [Acidimicrobiia bacterium]